MELQKALEIVDIKLPGHEVRELIRKHDTNVKDGKLDMVEFGEVSLCFCWKLTHCLWSLYSSVIL